jgi:Polysaccharide pyruvyl transferase
MSGCIRLLCSCDRYNYGDLLFPIVTRAALTALLGSDNSYDFTPYGLERSDLSKFGALPSRGIRDLYTDAKDGDVVLLAGGENLAQTWLVMHLTLLSAGAAARWEKYPRWLGASLVERLSRWSYRGRQPFPYVLSPDQFAPGVRVMYNSMGGWPLRFYPPPSQQAIAGALGKASFISVRDRESAAILREIDPGLCVHTAPDCVFLVADLLPREKLAEGGSPAVRELLQDAGEFFCFQCNPRYGQANREELKRQLRTLSTQSGLSIVFTPIGRMYSFEDDVFLTSLADEMEDRVRVLPAAATIYDILHTLAAARLFCGSSLHGIITALTYGVPFVPLLTDDPKLRNNLDSWEVGMLFSPAPVTDLAAQACRSLKLGPPLEHAARLRGAAHANMQRLAEAILAG